MSEFNYGFEVGDQVKLNFNTEINGAVITKEDIGEIVDQQTANGRGINYFFVVWDQYIDKEEATPGLWVYCSEMRKVSSE